METSLERNFLKSKKTCWNKQSKLLIENLFWKIFKKLFTFIR